jgi:hypothetical protein
MLRIAALLLLLASSAAAGELRPLGDTSLCLDGGTELQPGINRVQLAACTSEDGQNIRRGERNTIYIGSLCLQAVSIKGSDKVEIAAMRCHGRDGQIWIMTRDGRLSSGQKLCLTVLGEAAKRELLMTPCKEKPDDMTDQKWAIYGKFDK